jgi:hypothetical protein
MCLNWRGFEQTIDDVWIFFIRGRCRRKLEKLSFEAGLHSQE